MADFVNKLTLDVGAFIKGAESAKKYTDQISNSISEVNDETKAFLASIGGGFDKAYGEAQKNVKDLEKAIAAMIASGEGSDEEINKMRTALEQARSEVKKLDDALANIDPPVIEIVPDLSAFEKIQKESKDAEAKVEEIGLALKSALASGDADGVKKLRKELASAEKDAADLAKSIKKIDDEAGKTTVGQKLSKSFGEAKGALKSGDIAGAASGLSNALGSLPPQAAAVAGAAVALGGALKAGADKAREFDKASREVALQTGLTGEALKELEDAAKNAYVNGVGESAAEALKIVGTLKQTLGDNIATDQLDNVAVKANEVGKALGVETPELVAKISPLIKQYGLDADAAFNLVASASQSGVADIGGYLDAISEFTPNAKQAGLSAEEFAGKLQLAGKLGLKDLAKVGDGYKELSIRINDGSLAAEAANIAGPVGAQLTSIAEAARAGQITVEQAAQQYTQTLDKAVKGGEITVQQQGAFLSKALGSISEDLGTENTTLLFGAQVDEKSVKDAAAKAGKQINQNIAEQDPFGKIGKSLELFLQGAGRPILEVFNRIGTALTKIFGGTEDAGSGFEKFGEVVGDVIVALAEPTIALYEIIAGVVGAVRDAVGFFQDLFAGTDKVAETAKKQEDATRKQKKNSADLLKDAEALAKQGKLSAEEVDKLAKKYGVTAEEAQKAVDSSKQIGEAVKNAALEVNNLAAQFGNAQAAAGANLTANRTALAQLDQQIADAKKNGDKAQIDILTKRRKELVDAALAANKEQRKLDRSLDANTFATDPAARKARAAAIKEREAQQLKSSELIAAELIADTFTRESKIQEIEERFQRESLKNQIAGIDANTVAGRQQIADLNDQLGELDKQFAVQRTAIQAAEAERRFAVLQEKETQGLSALAAIQAEYIAKLQRNVDSFGFGDVESLVSGNIEAIKAQTDAAVRAVVEATPEFKKAAAVISFNLSKLKIDPATAQKQLTELRASIVASLLGDKSGENVLGKQLQSIFDAAERQAADTARAIRDSAKDAAVGLISSDIIRALEEQVRALEKQRDVVLQNTNLTADQRILIEQGFSKAIDKVRKGSLTAFQQSVVSISEALKSTTFELSTDEAQAELQAVLEANQKVIDSFNEGKITYQEALSQLQMVSEGQASFLRSLGQVGQQALASIAQGAQTATQATLDAIAELNNGILAFAQDDAKIGLERARQQKLVADSLVLTEEGKAQRIAEIAAASNEEIAKSSKEGQEAAQLIQEKQAKALEQMAVSAGSSFAALIASGENIGSALKSIAGDTAKALLALYTPDILALFSSILPPPFGLIAGGAAVASLQALLAAALNGFEGGGPTGDGVSSKKIVGVVHGDEFVAPKKMYKKHKKLLEHLYADKDVAEFPAIKQMLDENKISVLEDMKQGTSNATVFTSNVPVMQDLSPIVEELKRNREQLEAMEALHKTAERVEIVENEAVEQRRRYRAALKGARS